MHKRYISAYGRVDSTIMCKNDEKNDKFYQKVAFLMYTEMVNA